MTSRLVALCALICLLAAPLAAQNIGKPLVVDLDGDGRAERFALIDSGEGTVDLRIEDPSGQVTLAPGIAWMGGIGQQPELDLAPNGSVRLMSMNEAIGRNRWHQTLTIAYRRGAYRVVGFTYSWYDTLDLSASGTCDLNLLTGRGILVRNAAAERRVRTDWNALSVTQWNDAIGPPEVCEVD